MKKVLIVDDDVDILTVVQLVLNMHKYSVKAVSRWRDIPNAVAIFSPDLILLDVALSGADGRIICKQLKESTHTRHIPIILFSAHYDLVNNFRECMADGLVTKPFETPYLLETIRNYILS